MLPGKAGGKRVASLAELGATKLEAGEGGGWLIEPPLALQDEGVVVRLVEAAEFGALAHLHLD